MSAMMDFKENHWRTSETQQKNSRRLPKKLNLLDILKHRYCFCAYCVAIPGVDKAQVGPLKVWSTYLAPSRQGSAVGVCWWGVVWRFQRKGGLFGEFLKESKMNLVKMFVVAKTTLPPPPKKKHIKTATLFGVCWAVTCLFPWCRSLLRPSTPVPMSLMPSRGPMIQKPSRFPSFSKGFG